MEIAIFWFIMAILVAVYASKRGRSGFLALIVSLLLSPLIGFVIYAIAGESRRATERRIFEEERLRRDARRKLGE